MVSPISIPVPTGMIIVLLSAATPLWVTGCSQRQPQTGRQIEQAVRNHHPAAGDDPSDTADSTNGQSPRPANNRSAHPATMRDLSALPVARNTGDVIARVDGDPISRSKLVDLLIAAHGVGILEQLVALEQARAESKRKGIEVTPADIDAEADRALARLLSPIPPADPNASFDRAEAQRILDEILAQRNVSPDEYMLVIERNAHLRAAVEANMKFTPQQLQQEYQRIIRPTAHVRHVQVRTATEAQNAQGLLASGVEFAKVAAEMSLNRRTAPDGGRIQPFTRDDESIPLPIREVAFALKPREVSAPVTDGEWIHIVRLDKLEKPMPVGLAAAKADVERSLRERLVDPAMQTLFRTLFEQADIQIVDTTLEREFQRKHPDRAISAP